MNTYIKTPITMTSKYAPYIEAINWPGLTFYSVVYSYREDGVTKTDAKDFYTYEEAKEFYNSINQ